MPEAGIKDLNREIAPADESGEPGVYKHEELSEVETKIIGIFVNITRLLAIPKSVGEIYGVIYCSEEPMTVPEITARLGISKATASYALRFLGNINAIRVTREMGVRHDFFTAETSLRKLAAGFLSERVQPFMDERAADLDDAAAELEAMPADDPAARRKRRHLEKRLKMLRSWHRKGSMALPLIRRIFRNAG